MAYGGKGMGALDVFVDVLDKKGDLHDCRILEIFWDIKEKTVRLAMADINSNFLGLPEYPGLCAGCVVMSDVESVVADLRASSSELRIFEVTARKEGAAVLVEARLAPAGLIKVLCGSVRLDDGAR